MVGKRWLPIVDTESTGFVSIIQGAVGIGVVGIGVFGLVVLPEK